MNKYAIYENYDVNCGLSDSKNHCKKYKGRPCCFFCKDKQHCNKACKNDPTVCFKAVCEDKK